MQNWKRPQDWINLIAGVYLFAVPYAVDLGTTAANTAWTMGAVIAVLALWALGQAHQATPMVLKVIAGAWVILSPWALGFAGIAAAWNFWVAGAVVVVSALSTIPQHRESFAGSQRQTA